MIPTFNGQAVLGPAASMAATIYAGTADDLNSLLGYAAGTWRYPTNGAVPSPDSVQNTILVEGILTGTTTAAVQAAQATLTGLAVALNQPYVAGQSYPSGAVGPLVVPTGVSGSPDAPLHVAKLNSPASAGSSTLSLNGTWGLSAGGYAYVFNLTQSGETVLITGISGTTLTIMGQLQFSYAVGCRVTPMVAMQPWLTLYPNGSDDATATASYPGWDTWHHSYFGTNDIVYGTSGIVASQGGGYQVGYTVAFRTSGLGDKGHMPQSG